MDQDSRENKTNCFPRDLTLSVQSLKEKFQGSEIRAWKFRFWDFFWFRRGIRQICDGETARSKN